MLKFNGYEASSPTLRPSPTAGDCMGAEWKGCVAWIDAAAPIESGDIVQLCIKYDDGVVTRIIKRLEATRDGRWWGVCEDGVFQIGTDVQPCWIAKVVAREPMTRPLNIPVARKANEATRAYYAEVAEPAVREWREQGYVRGLAFPGLAAVNYGGAPQ
jgi:hypothetical protein